MDRRKFLGAMLAGGAAGSLLRPARAAEKRRLLYVALPGIRNYLEYGGIGIAVYDIDQGHRFLRRVPTWPVAEGKPVENVKGVAASAATGMLYVSTIRRVRCITLKGEELVWENQLPGGCDRMALSPDGRLLYVPSLEGPHWNVVDAISGELIHKVVTDSGAHNTIYGPDGKRCYLAGLKSPLLHVADTSTHTVVQKVGPFSSVIRPFTINRRQTRCVVNVNDLLGFEVGDLTTGKMLHRVEVSGFSKGPIKRHGCPSHGVGYTPDEKELWVCDAANERMHVFDATVMPPKQVTSIKLRDQPGWITFSLDGKYAYPSTGEVVDTKSKAIVTALADEDGKPVHSEKMVEVHWNGDRPTRNGDQFGIGRRA